MKSLIIIALLTGFSGVAQAAGFQCESPEPRLTVSVYNHVQPEMGTHNAAVMIVSDPMVSVGRKTIAIFTDENGTLDNIGADYIGKVDLRFKESRRKGELIAHTKLGQLANIHLNVDFSYSEPMENGEYTTGEVVLEKRNGDTTRFPVLCSRYLKN